MFAAFWMVWNPGHGVPNVKHKTLAGAKTEAERLAKLHPGQDFIVLQAMEKCRTTTPIHWETADLPLPF